MSTPDGKHDWDLMISECRQCGMTRQSFDENPEACSFAPGVIAIQYLYDRRRVYNLVHAIVNEGA